MDKLRLMESYSCVVRCGSFGAAAQQLGVSAAVVTKHVAKLENMLGMRLINRTTRHLKITDVGLAYAEFCDRTLHEIENTEKFLSRRDDEPCGKLKVVSTKAFASTTLGNIIGQFSQHHPNIEISAVISDTRMDDINLVEAAIDLVVRLSRPPESSYIMKRLCSMRWVACASPKYLARAGAPRVPQDLAEANCLVHTRLTPDRIWHFSHISHNEEATVKVGGTIRSNGILLLRGCALADAGIALLPNYCVTEDIAAGRLVEVLPDYVGPCDEIFAVFPHRHGLPKRVRLFIEFLVEKLHDPWWESKSVATIPSADISSVASSSEPVV